MRTVFSVKMFSDPSVGIYGGSFDVEIVTSDTNVDISDLSEYLKDCLKDYSDGGSVNTVDTDDSTFLFIS